MLAKFAGKFVSVTLACATLALAASLALAQPAPAKVTLTLGSDGYWYLLHYITEGAGLYKAEGIAVDVVRFSSGSKIIASVLGGSADASMVNIGNSTLAIEKGGDIATLMTLYTIMPFAVVLSNDALKKTGITPAMPLDERVKRLKGLRIATTGPGSGTDQFMRTLFVARGMNPDKEVTLQTLGDGGTMLAAMEVKAIDGFVLGAPTTNQAVQKGLRQDRDQRHEWRSAGVQRADVPRPDRQPGRDREENVRSCRRWCALSHEGSNLSGRILLRRVV